LIQLLWDVADDPRGGLRWCLSKLRPLVNDAAVTRLDADRLDVRFQPGDAVIDCQALQEIGSGNDLARHPTPGLEKAAALFRGEFLEGLEFPDFHAFHAWLVAMRQETRRSRQRILEALVTRLEDTPQPHFHTPSPWSNAIPGTPRHKRAWRVCWSAPTPRRCTSIARLRRHGSKRQ
jgi:DNA-binding SARP family transcriptional activator